MARFVKMRQAGRLRRQSDRPLSALEDGLRGRVERQAASVVLCSRLDAAGKQRLLDSLRNLREANYLSELVLALEYVDDDCLPALYAELATLPFPQRIIRSDSPALAAIDRALAEQGLPIPRHEPQRCAWYALGYVWAAQHSEALGMCFSPGGDAQRQLLAKLVAPLVSETGGVDFCIGDYSAGGGTASASQDLLVVPLINALIGVCGRSPVLHYLNSLRRPAPAAVGFHRGMIAQLRLPDSEAIELGFVAELERNGSGRGFHQVDAEQGEARDDAISHSGHDPRRVAALVKTLFNYLLSDGQVLDPPTLQTIKLSYQRIASDRVEERREQHAASNMSFDLHCEEQLVEDFAACVYQAGRAVAQSREGFRYLASWSRVEAAIPNIAQELVDAIESDPHAHMPVPKSRGRNFPASA